MSKTPLARSGYPHSQAVSTRWTDNDIYGHVNNAVYYQYFDSVINAYLIDQGGLDIHDGAVVGFIVHSECDYFSPVAYPGALTVGLAVRKLGNSSVTYQLGLFAAGQEQPAAQAAMVHVFVDTATNKPVAIPAPLRAALARLTLPDSAER